MKGPHNGLKLQGSMMMPVQKAICVSEKPRLLYMSDTTVPPNTRLGNPIPNQVVGIQRSGCCFVCFAVFNVVQVVAAEVLIECR